MKKDKGYFKKENIIAQLMKEILSEGPKRPTQIKALQNYGSKQDRYRLLKQLVEEGILQYERSSYKKVEYSIPSELQTFLQEYRFAQGYLDALGKIPALKFKSSREAESYYKSILLFQLTKILKAIHAIVRYTIHKPEARPKLTVLIYGEIDRMLDVLESTTKDNRNLTEQALESVSQILLQKANEFDVVTNYKE